MMTPVEALFATMVIAFPLAGLATRRWTALALPVVGWPLLYLGLDQGWWGNGLGDGWQYVAAAALFVGVVSTVLLVGLGRRLKPRRSPHFA